MCVYIYVKFTCVVVTSVHLPCRTMLSTHAMLVVRAVKGEAMLASPRCTSVGSLCHDKLAHHQQCIHMWISMSRLQGAQG